MISAKSAGSSPSALLPRLNSRLNMSSQVLTGEVFQVAHTEVSLVMLPSQVSRVGTQIDALVSCPSQLTRVGSKFAALSSGSASTPRLTLASLSPSSVATTEPDWVDLS